MHSLSIPAPRLAHRDQHRGSPLHHLRSCIRIQPPRRSRGLQEGATWSSTTFVDAVPSDNQRRRGATMNLEQIIAESVLGTIQWRTDTEGFCQCPGAHLHTTTNQKKDCIVRISRPSTVFCFHSSCEHEIARSKTNLYRALAAPSGLTRSTKKLKLTSEETNRRQEAAKKRSMALRAKSTLAVIIKEYRISEEQLLAESPISIPIQIPTHSKLLIQHLFNPSDVIWIGDTHDSGKPRHARHFKTAQHWAKWGFLKGPFIVPSTFNPGSVSRCKSNVLLRRYLVIESDTLPAEDFLSVVNWCRLFMPLHAVVHTGGKSRHGWFDTTFLNPEAWVELRSILPALEADSALFRESQPVRLPGVRRGTDQWQRLLFLAPRKEGL